MSHNLFQFIGNLTRDTEFRQSETSKRAVFDMAVNRTWRGEGGEKIGKGSKVFVQGRIEPTKYEKGDKTEYGFDFIAEEIEYLDTKAPSHG